MAIEKRDFLKGVHKDVMSFPPIKSGTVPSLCPHFTLDTKSNSETGQIHREQSKGCQPARTEVKGKGRQPGAGTMTNCDSDTFSTRSEGGYIECPSMGFDGSETNTTRTTKEGMEELGKSLLMDRHSVGTSLKITEQPPRSKIGILW
jgi:hypothetical protein